MEEDLNSLVSNQPSINVEELSKVLNALMQASKSSDKKLKILEKNIQIEIDKNKEIQTTYNTNIEKIGNNIIIVEYILINLFFSHSFNLI